MLARRGCPVGDLPAARADIGVAVDGQAGEGPDDTEQAEDPCKPGSGDGGHGRYAPFDVTTLPSLTLSESHSRVTGTVPDVFGNLFPARRNDNVLGNGHRQAVRIRLEESCHLMVDFLWWSGLTPRRLRCIIVLPS